MVKGFLYETFKLIVYALIISLFFSSVYALPTFVLKGNVTNEAAAGWNFANNYTCVGASWGLSSTNCQDGNCLRSTIGSGGGYGYCYIVQQKFLMDKDNTYLIKGWYRDEGISNGGGYVGNGYVNSTGTPLVDFAVYQCETQRVTVRKNATALNSVMAQATTLPAIATCKASHYWVETIFNATSNKYGFAIYDSPAKATTYYKNWTMTDRQDYQGYLGFHRFRDVSYDDVELWELQEVVAPSSQPFKINARNNTGTYLTKFNATIGGNTYATTNGTLNTGLLKNATSKYNITVRAYDYVIRQYFNYNVSVNLTANLTRTGIRSFNVGNYLTISGNNYTRTLNYNYTYLCYSGGKSQLVRYVNNILNTSTALTCTNSTQSGTGTFKRSVEGKYNLSFIYNTSFGYNEIIRTNDSYYQDLNPPTVSNISFTINSDTFVLPSANISMICTDNIMPTALYTLKVGSTLLYNKSKTIATRQSNITSAISDGVNYAYAYCNDGFNRTTLNLSKTLFLKNLFLIDEQDNTAFNIPNASSLIVFIDDNRTSYDFTANNRANITFIADTEVKLRFQIIYDDGTIILRYVDIGLTEEDVRVCVNKEGITHYEQILTSYEVRPVVLNSVFADCLVAADYTRFAYQNAKILKAYTYNNLYYLYTYENNDPTQNQVFLASVDGSIATYINLDTLEFLEQGYEISTIGDSITVNKRNANEMNVYYYNVLQNNDDLRIAIVNADTDEVYFNSSAFSDNNEAEIIFNFATLGANETTLFKIYASKTIDGEVTTINKFFNINGVTGSQNSALIAIVSIFIIIFGLSFTVASRAFAWFGIFIMVFNFALLSFASSAWYITFLQAINAIILIYIFLVMNAKNSVEIG